MNANICMFLIIVFAIVVTCINIWLYGPTERRVKKFFFMKVPIYSGEELTKRVMNLFGEVSRNNCYRNGYVLIFHFQSENLNQRKFDFNYLEIICNNGIYIYCGTDNNGKFHSEMSYKPKTETYVQMWLDSKGNPNHIIDMLKNKEHMPNAKDKAVILNRYRNYVLNDIL